MIVYVPDTVFRFLRLCGTTVRGKGTRIDYPDAVKIGTMRFCVRYDRYDEV